MNENYVIKRGGSSDGIFILTLKDNPDAGEFIIQTISEKSVRFIEEFRMKRMSELNESRLSKIMQHIENGN